ncbi:MAG: MGMT family protein [Patescibacteria group bacterium]|nr:MGMT family protein [Patescibacteria group bacterium]MDD5490252.1 MGMT family protein [Patescibacteria group bacterium]
MRDFKKSVLALTARIPSGRVTTYKILSHAAGHSGAWRAVANVLAKNKNYKEIPCHRVIKSDGSLGEYNRGVKKKRKLLLEEGVRVGKKKIVELERNLYYFKFNKNK